MNHHSFLQWSISTGLILSLVVGCSAPAVAPTQAIDIPTLLPPTAMPIPPTPTQAIDTPTPLPPTTTPIPPTPTSEQYQVLTEADGLKCGAFVGEITYEYDGPPEGQLVSFQCLDRGAKAVQISLTTKTIEKGEIVTTEFGIIRMAIAGCGMPGIAYCSGKQTLRAVVEEGLFVYARYYLTPSQVHQLREYLGW